MIDPELSLSIDRYLWEQEREPIYYTAEADDEGDFYDYESEIEEWES